jgi:hypothetical protein
MSVFMAFTQIRILALDRLVVHVPVLEIADLIVGT